MKVIDLLNKIANGEIERNKRYQFSKDDYCTIGHFFNKYIIDEENLNLEIIEEKKIPEKISREEFGQLPEGLKISCLLFNYNYLIDYLKQKGII